MRAIVLRPLFSLSIIAMVMVYSARSAAAETDFQIIHDRYFDAAMLQQDHSAAALQKAHKLAATMKLDGSWANVDYADQSRSIWGAFAHITNVQVMAAAYEFSHEPVFKTKATTALEYWLKNDPQNPNWWYNQIGVPLALGDIAMILGNDISDADRNQIIEVMKRSKWERWSGQNLDWGCGIQIVRGLLEKNKQTVSEAYKRLYEEIRIGEPKVDGIKADASFHQHGPQFYSGGYGLGFARDAGRFISYAWGTGLQIPPENMRVYSRYILDGEQWMIRGGVFDYSAMGRGITDQQDYEWIDKNHPSAKTWIDLVRFTRTVSQLTALNISRQKEYQQFDARLVGAPDATPLSGNRYFWCSDYMAHQRPSFFVSIRMFSTRVKNTEEVNDEGKKSHHVADGCTYLYRTGDEYRGIFPTWDWNKVPGTTAEQADLELDKNGNHMMGKSDFVGGVSDGTYGLAVQDLIHGKLHAHKFWMMFDDGFIAMGNGIECPTENPVVTSINQCLLKGDVVRSEHAIQHDGFTYFIPAPQKFILTTAAQSGRWSDIGPESDKLVTKDVFNLWIDHGKNPRQADYVYYVFAGEDHSTDGQVLRNTPELQAVFHRKLNLLGLAFWKAGRLDMENTKSVAVDQPCLVLVKKDSISVSNPTNEAIKVNLTLDGGKPILFDLPGGVMAGSTVTHQK